MKLTSIRARQSSHSTYRWCDRVRAIRIRQSQKRERQDWNRSNALDPNLNLWILAILWAATQAVYQRVVCLMLPARNLVKLRLFPNRCKSQCNRRRPSVPNAFRKSNRECMSNRNHAQSHGPTFDLNLRMISTPPAARQSVTMTTWLKLLLMSSLLVQSKVFVVLDLQSLLLLLLSCQHC